MSAKISQFNSHTKDKYVVMAARSPALSTVDEDTVEGKNGSVASGEIVSLDGMGTIDTAPPPSSLLSHLDPHLLEPMELPAAQLPSPSPSPSPPPPPWSRISSPPSPQPTPSSPPPSPPPIPAHSAASDSARDFESARDDRHVVERSGPSYRPVRTKRRTGKLGTIVESSASSISSWSSSSSGPVGLGLGPPGTRNASKAGGASRTFAVKTSRLAARNTLRDEDSKKTARGGPSWPVYRTSPSLFTLSSDRSGSPPNVNANRNPALLSAPASSSSSASLTEPIELIRLSQLPAQQPRQSQPITQQMTAITVPSQSPSVQGLPQTSIATRRDKLQDRILECLGGREQVAHIVLRAREHGRNIAVLILFISFVLGVFAFAYIKSRQRRSGTGTGPGTGGGGGKQHKYVTGTGTGIGIGDWNGSDEWSAAYEVMSGRGGLGGWRKWWRGGGVARGREFSPLAQQARERKCRWRYS